jgi:hypothetical protein
MTRQPTGRLNRFLSCAILAFDPAIYSEPLQIRRLVESWQKPPDADGNGDGNGDGSGRSSFKCWKGGTELPMARSELRMNEERAHHSIIEKYCRWMGVTHVLKFDRIRCSSLFPHIQIRRLKFDGCVSRRRSEQTWSISPIL